MSRYALIVGARPNFVKAAALVAYARTLPDRSILLVHTGQHYDRALSRVFFEELGLPEPDLFLEPQGEAHADRLGRMITGLAQSLAPSAEGLAGILTVGDVDSTLAGAVAGARLKVPVHHIEAGLRSRDRRMPEEMNRIMVDHLSEKLFTSEPAGKENLLREGIAAGSIYEAGNLMIESLERFRHRFVASAAASLGLAPKGYYLATIHRFENMDDTGTVERLFGVLAELAHDLPVVLPLHPSARTRLKDLGLTRLLAPLRTVEPLSYFAFMGLVQESAGVVTDSGGVQEETSHLGIPCATLRDSTERPVTLTHGTNKLFPPAELSEGTADRIRAHLARDDFKAGSIPLWDAHVSARIFANL